jgi:hypothetical protein
MRGSLVERSVRGAVSGVVAIVPMSLLMLIAQRLGALPRQPPEEITDATTRRVGLKVSEDTSNALSVLGHVAYGAGIGAAYGCLVPAHFAGRSTGVAYGLGVYGASYLGWLPALRLRPAGQGHANKPTLAMVLAHVVYGGVLGRLASTSLGRSDPHRPRSDSSAGAVG